LLSQAASGTKYTWTGSTSTDWRTPSNWNPSGVPGPSDTVVIVSSASNEPIITQSDTVAKLIMTSGTLDLGALKLTVTDSAFFNGGTITGTAQYAVNVQGAYAKFAGTQVDADVYVACNTLLLDGSTFNAICHFKHTGGSTSTGQGGNTFNDEVIIENTGGILKIAESNPNTVNDDLRLYTYGNRDINVSDAGAWFNGDVYVNSTGTGGISFGYAGVSIDTLTSGKVIAVGDSGFTTGTLLIKNLVQLGSSSQILTLTGTGVLNLMTCQFEASCTFSAPSIVAADCIFSDEAEFEQTGAWTTVWSGRNVFNGA